MNSSVHPSEVNRYQPPRAVAQHLISHAVRDIPGSKQILDRVFHRQKFNQLEINGLKPHEYNDSGRLQFAFG